MKSHFKHVALRIGKVHLVIGLLHEYEFPYPLLALPMLTEFLHSIFAMASIRGLYSNSVMKLFLGAKTQHDRYVCVTNKQSIITHTAGYFLIVKITPKELGHGIIDCEN